MIGQQIELLIGGCSVNFGCSRKARFVPLSAGSFSKPKLFITNVYLARAVLPPLERGLSQH